MTMHLVNGLTSLNTKKRKTKRKPDSYYEPGWRKHNKLLKRLNTDTMTLNEYIDYIRGVYKPIKKRYPVKTYTPGSVVSTVSTSVSKTESEGSIPSTSAKPNIDGGTRNWKQEQERIQISKQYTIVPAYNKGPYMVVSKKDLMKSIKSL